MLGSTQNGAKIPYREKGSMAFSSFRSILKKV